MYVSEPHHVLLERESDFRNDDGGDDERRQVQHKHLDVVPLEVGLARHAVDLAHGHLVDDRLCARARRQLLPVTA